MKLRHLAVILLLLFAALPAQAASLRLGWNPSPGPLVVGYRVHYGLKPGKYTKVVRVKGRLTTKVTIKGLKRGTTYFFAVTACNKMGKESPLSSEISGKPGQKDNTKTDPVSPPASHKEAAIAKIAPKTLKTGPGGKILPTR
ncbi:MAG: fibronectin type III domain-containing protein [Syntrophobacteraceae bacterium]